MSAQANARDFTPDLVWHPTELTGFFVSSEPGKEFTVKMQVIGWAVSCEPTLWYATMIGQFWRADSFDFVRVGWEIDDWNVR